MGRAIERRELQRLTPVGAARDDVARVLRSVVETIHGGDTKAAAGDLGRSAARGDR